MSHFGLDPESILQLGTHFEGWMPENKFSMTSSFLFIFQRSPIIIFYLIIRKNEMILIIHLFHLFTLFTLEEWQTPP